MTDFEVNEKLYIADLAKNDRVGAWFVRDLGHGIILIRVLNGTQYTVRIKQVHKEPLGSTRHS